MNQELAGLNAVVTGSASGIGLATANMLRGYGVTVVGLDINRGELSSDMEWFPCDVTSLSLIHI